MISVHCGDVRSKGNISTLLSPSLFNSLNVSVLLVETVDHKSSWVSLIQSIKIQLPSITTIY